MADKKSKKSYFGKGQPEEKLLITLDNLKHPSRNLTYVGFHMISNMNDKLQSTYNETNVRVWIRIGGWLVICFNFDD